jgi:hypothetical protein
VQGGRNLPKTHVTVVNRVPTRHREPTSPTRSADEALLNFVLGRQSGGGDDVRNLGGDNEDHELGSEFVAESGGDDDGGWETDNFTA